MGPDIERIPYDSGTARTEARKQFWTVINGGLGFPTWDRSSRWLATAVKEDEGRHGTSA